MKEDRGPHFSRRRLLGMLSLALGASVVPRWGASQDVSRRLQIWFIRHAESQINVPDAARPVVDAGMSYPLTARGVAQAKSLAASLADVPVLAIYTSTHLRAVQTADAISFQHGVPITLAPEAVEIEIGADEGSDPRAAYLELARTWVIERNLDARLPGGESFADVQRRFLPFVRDVMNRHALDAGVVIILGHSATLGLMAPVLAPNAPLDMALRRPLPHTGVIKTELRDSRLFCTEWVGLPHSEFSRLD